MAAGPWRFRKQGYSSEKEVLEEVYKNSQEGIGALFPVFIVLVIIYSFIFFV